MSVGINQLIMAILNPFMLGLFGFLAGTVAALCAWRRTGCTMLGLSFVWMWVWSSGWCYHVLGRHLEDAFPQQSIERVEGPIDAVHVLGGGMGVNTNDCLYAEIWSGADRVWMGAKLWKSVNRVDSDARRPLLICSGPCVRESTLPLLSDLGVETNRVVLLEAARNTEEEALMGGDVVRRGAEEKGRTRRPRVALVTSVWHMRRAKFLFEECSGCEIVPVPCDYECTTEYGPSHAWRLADFVPSAQWIARNGYLLKEYIAYWGYRVKYWL